MAKCNSDILDHSLHTGLQHNFKDAIEDAGGVVPASACLWEYPEIIRKNLVAKTISNINIRGKDIIQIQPVSENDTMVYEISTNIDTSKLKYPNYAEQDSSWGHNTDVNTLVTSLFNNILPAVRGVHSGDISVSDPDGNDTQDWFNPAFNKTGRKTGLATNSRYMRIYLTCQAEPIFINMGNVVKEITGGYNIKNSDTVVYELNEETMTMSTHINVISDEQMNQLK
jgi:hypothetical protein